MSRFTVYADKKQEFRWKFHANDDSVVARSSEGYRSKEDCLASLGTLQREVAGATVMQVGPGAAPSGGVEAAAAVPQATAGGGRAESGN